MDFMDNNEFEELLNNYKLNKNKPLKILMYLYKGDWKKIFLSTIFFVMKSSPTWIIPIIAANIIDIASKPSKHSLTEIWINLIIAVIALLQNFLTQFLHVKYLSQAVRDVESKLRSGLVRKLHQLSIIYHKDLQAGKLQSKVLRDVEGIQFLSMQFSATILPVVFNIGIGLAITASKSIIVALFFLITIPISIVFTLFFRINIRKGNTEFRKEIEQMSSKVAEMLNMVSVTRAHGLENIEIEKMKSIFYNIRDKGYHLDMITSLFSSSTWITLQIFQVICIAFTGSLAYKGKISIGDVVLYQVYFTSIINQISNLINMYPNIVKGMESINSVGEIFIADDIEDNNGKKKIKNINGEISFEDVEFIYPHSKKSTLKNFNIKIKKGETIALVGESGAGKTTILNLLIGFNKPTSGKIYIDGIDMSQIDLRSYRNFLSVVSQDITLLSGTIRENITYGLELVSEKKLKEVLEAANIKEFVEKLPEGIDTKIGENGGKLSGGQRQRIAIARAIIRDPRIIILDEATSSLDNISELLVQKAVNTLVKNRTTFIVAHRLSTVRDADRIMVIKNGTCIECGSYDELILKQGEFYNLSNLRYRQHSRQIPL